MYVGESLISRRCGRCYVQLKHGRPRLADRAQEKQGRQPDRLRVPDLSKARRAGPDFPH